MVITQTELAIKELPYGRRVFTNVIDDVACIDPSRHCLSIPRSSNPKDGWKHISFSQYANAINRLSHWIVDRAGPSPEGQFPTFAYIGPNDIRYLVVVAAAAKCQFKVLLISPRNHKEAQLSLFDATDCKWLFYTPEFSDLVQPWLQERDLKSAIVEEIGAMLSDEIAPHFSYSKDFEEACWDPYMVLHTSGSTGTPKPIICRHGMIAQSDAYHQQATWLNYTHMAKAFSERANTMLCTMPLYHALGIYMFLSFTVYWNTPMALVCPEKPLTPETAVEFIHYSLADATVLPPSTLAEMSHNADYLETLKNLSFVTTGGGALEPEAGDRLVEAGVELQAVISSTEYGFYPLYWQPRKDLWRFFILNNDLFGCDYRKTGDGVYEQVIVRNSQPSKLQGIFYTFPESKEFETKDLYQAHPTLKNHWLHLGRIDDVIVFSNGEKLNPVSLETIVGSHPEIHRAVVIGQGRFQAGMILEPIQYPKDENERRELLGRVWPVIQSANKETVAHGRIARHMVIIADPSMPFPYSSKGSLQRGAMLKLYSDKIESLYNDSGILEAPTLDIASSATLMQSIIDMFQNSIGLLSLEPDMDLFQNGFDSLQAMNASKNLNAGLQNLKPSCELKIAPRDIYSNPTPRLLSEYIYLRLNDGDYKNFAENETLDLEAMLEKQLKILPKAPGNKRPAPFDQEQTVLLTGSTGSLGSYMLDQMESCNSVKKIFCLNRGEDGGMSRQPVVSKERGLRTSYPKTEFFHADLSRPYLGLEKTVYDRLLDLADCIIHSAWTINFNHAAKTFEPQIQGTTQLLNFAIQAKKQVPIVFLSSIGTVDNWKEPRPIPETHLPDYGLASNGYGQSKLIGSSILHYGMEQLNVPSKILRVGQIAGPLSELGQWNPSEWLPIIIASSIQLGILPRDLGSLDVVEWMPVEDVASTVLEISGVTSQQPALDMTGYFNVVNPSPVHWAELTPAVREFYGQKGLDLKLVSLAEWVKVVEESAEIGNRNPAIKLLETFKSMIGKAGSASPQFALDRARMASSTFTQMDPITPEMVQRWCRQWNFESNLQHVAP
ncbi:hypothetical protein BGW36DRAFT_352001 [Talaromyces proteolyticus]|uniref:Carrier domain-containing protein n=1 Tax=Talaromyces proteolyticus TaxID=1131652 RepID=A0AAD4PUN9_9EURO|nr:uncharacterized protein BGW36DRAFT_352001 [Talaromyces proteolyticus]KAH8689580.1 hypothetical protein BGW36DRAFT_352001 [Talaromyces proteolyticus]